MRSRLSKETAASKLAMLHFLISGFPRCLFNGNLHLKTGLARNSRWSCPPQTAESLRFAAVSGTPPGKLAGVPCSSLRQQEHGAMVLFPPDRRISEIRRGLGNAAGQIGRRSVLFFEAEEHGTPKLRYQYLRTCLPASKGGCRGCPGTCPRRPAC